VTCFLIPCQLLSTYNITVFLIRELLVINRSFPFQIRLEDVLVVGSDAAEPFIALPRTADEVEQLMASSKR
jgi:hypothetical protein